MKLLSQPQDAPNCLVYSAAMVFDVEPQSILNFIGHDGQAEWWPHAFGIGKKRGVHIQEIVDYGLNIEKALTPYEANPRQAPAGFEDDAIGVYSTIYHGYENLTAWLKYLDAIIITRGHAVAWNHKEILCYDPNGMIRGIREYEVIEAWLVNEIKSPL